MKRLYLALSILVLLSLACSLVGLIGGGEESAAPTETPRQSEKRCGDGVCDGPENANNCTEDCQAAGIPEATTTSGENDGKLTPETEAQGKVFAQVYVEVQVSRDDGVGDCSMPPWGVDHIAGGDFNCVPPKYWYGYNLKATAFQLLQLTPAGENAWLIAGAKPGGGTYQEAAHWSDGQRVCWPTAISGQTFGLDANGNYQDDKIELTFLAEPKETSDWVCDGGQAYVRETTLLLIDWAIAMSGDYTNLSATLDSRHRVADGFYRHEFTMDTNPSPNNRDHVTATLEFSCVEPQQAGTYTTVACPWEE